MENVAIMIEDAAAQEWERLNAPTDVETLRQAAKTLGHAINELDEVSDCVNEAAEALVDTPEGDRVASILSEIESLLKEMKEYKQKWEAA